MKRPENLRQPPLDHSMVRRGDEVGDGIIVWSAPRYKVFIEAMWHGDYQQVPVDPDEIPALIAALEEARALADSHDVAVVDDA
jgi:hypothetical protein